MDHRRSNNARRNGDRPFGIAARFHPSALRSCLPQHRFRLPVGIAVHGPSGRRAEAFAQVCPEVWSALVAGRALQSQCWPPSPAGRLGRLRTLHPERSSETGTAGTFPNPPDAGADHGRAGAVARILAAATRGSAGAWRQRRVRSQFSNTAQMQQQHARQQNNVPKGAATA